MLFRSIANTRDEADQLVNLYEATPGHVDVIHPGVDLDLFTPGNRLAARKELGIPADALLLLFVGRIQPLKAPDVLLRAAHRMLERDPSLRSRLVVAVCGGPSGSGLDHPSALVDLAAELGILDVVRFEPPSDRQRLVTWFRAADATVVPSHSESFGLVAVESQACGTPVVATSVGGLRTAVADERSGLLVPGHNIDDWSLALARISTSERQRLALNARAHAESFSWSATAAGLIDSYGRAIAARTALPLAAGSR